MQGLVVVGFIVEEILNVDVKCAKYRSRSPGQDTCPVSTSRRRNMQGLVVRHLTLEEI